MKSVLRILWAVSASVALAATAFADTLIVTHTSGPDTISRDDVKGILLGNKTNWENGTTVKLAVQVGGPVHDAVVQEFTSRSADQFDKYWKKLVFTGKGAPPESFRSDNEVLRYVAATPGAFGYIGSDTAPAGVKVITVK